MMHDDGYAGLMRTPAGSLFDLRRMLPSMGRGIAAAGKRLISAGIRTSAAPLMLSEVRTSAAGCLMGKRSIFAGGGGRGLPSASVAASRGGIWAGTGAAAPLMWRRGDFMRAAPSRSMADAAAPKEEVGDSFRTRMQATD